MQYPNPRVKVIDGHVVLSVVDTETYDYIEDILAEGHDLAWSYMETGEDGGKPLYILHFLGMSDPRRLQTIVDEIDQNELRRIWNLNN